MDKEQKVQRHWLRLAARVARLAVTQPHRTVNLVTQSYDALARGYDHAWTQHMRDLTVNLVDEMGVGPGAQCLDLTCGTGFITSLLAQRAGRSATGVDASAGMLEVARQTHPDCTFIHADVVNHLRTLPPRSVDVITCGWGLGYTQPLSVLFHVARVLRPGGRVAIIDNSLFSLLEVVWTSVLVFAERPEALQHVMRVRFLPGHRWLCMMLRGLGLRVVTGWSGSRTYHVADGYAAIARLRETGAAAGFEFAADPGLEVPIFNRFAQVLQQRHAGPNGVPITHRYLAAIGERA